MFELNETINFAVRLQVRYWGQQDSLQMRRKAMQKAHELRIMFAATNHFTHTHN